MTHLTPEEAVEALGIHRDHEETFLALWGLMREPAHRETELDNLRDSTTRINAMLEELPNLAPGPDGVRELISRYQFVMDQRDGLRESERQLKEELDQMRSKLQEAVKQLESIDRCLAYYPEIEKQGVRGIWKLCSLYEDAKDQAEELKKTRAKIDVELSRVDVEKTGPVWTSIGELVSCFLESQQQLSDRGVQLAEIDLILAAQGFQHPTGVEGVMEIVKTVETLRKRVDELRAKGGDQTSQDQSDLLKAAVSRNGLLGTQILYIDSDLHRAGIEKFPSTSTGVRVLVDRYLELRDKEPEKRSGDIDEQIPQSIWDELEAAQTVMLALSPLGTRFANAAFLDMVGRTIPLKDPEGEWLGSYRFARMERVADGTKMAFILERMEEHDPLVPLDENPGE